MEHCLNAMYDIIKCLMYLVLTLMQEKQEVINDND